MVSTTIVWFRQDLRLDDNPALSAAASIGDPVIPVYIWAPEEEGVWQLGGASRWWLQTSLHKLDVALRGQGSRLTHLTGDSQTQLLKLVKAHQVSKVFFNRRYEPDAIKRDQAVTDSLKAAGVEVQVFDSALLFDQNAIFTAEGRPYQKFTPYFRTCLQHRTHPPINEPAKLTRPAGWPKSDILDLDYPASAYELSQSWNPGETGAMLQLQKFLDAKVYQYASGRDQPSSEGVSRLSPHLHFGEISIRRIWQVIEQQTSGRLSEDVEIYKKELVWREFAYYLLSKFPQTADEPLRQEFQEFPWSFNEESIQKWCRGETGYPIVDAGMRQLQKTGWMHNRVRMVVASFLTKHLLVSWQVGARWFWQTLVDADLANNTFGWQWSAGCGADAAPYFRIFNPVLQGKKFDANGDYVRKWVPELAGLSNKWIHEPWNAPPLELHEAGITLGENYPHPMVDHKEARTQALQAFATIRGAGLQMAEV